MLAALFFGFFVSVINIREVVFFAQPRDFFISLDFDARRESEGFELGFLNELLLCCVCYVGCL